MYGMVWYVCMYVSMSICMFCAQIELNRCVFFCNLCHWDLFALCCLAFWSNLKARFYVLNTQLVVFKNHVVLHYHFSLPLPFSVSLSFTLACSLAFARSLAHAHSLTLAQSPVFFLSRSFALFDLNGLLTLYCSFVSTQCDFI